MKHRNKKTGKVIDCKEILILREDSEGLWQVGQGSSLAELNKAWEGYNPTKPHRKGGMTRFELLAMAEMVLRGHFGNGRERRERLGEHYEQVQRIVDVIIEEEK